MNLWLRLCISSYYLDLTSGFHSFGYLSIPIWNQAIEYYISIQPSRAGLSAITLSVCHTRFDIPSSLIIVFESRCSKFDPQLFENEENEDSLGPESHPSGNESLVKARDAHLSGEADQMRVIPGMGRIGSQSNRPKIQIRKVIIF